MDLVQNRSDKYKISLTQSVQRRIKKRRRRKRSCCLSWSRRSVSLPGRWYPLDRRVSIRTGSD